MKTIIGLLLLVTLLAGPSLQAGAQDGGEVSCPVLVQTAYETTQNACDGVGRDEACYGNVNIQASFQADAEEVPFAASGDTVRLAALENLQLSSMDTEEQIWGISLLHVRADLPEDDPTQNVEVLLFGNVEIENQGTPLDDETPVEDDEPRYGPMQAFYFTSGVDDRPCAEAPDSGLMIQTPEGAGEITFLINEVNIDLGSTAYLQAQPDDEMTVNLIEGQADVTAQGVTVTAPAGTRVRIPLNANGVASGAPIGPEPYDDAALQTLPLLLLSQPIVVAPALTEDEIAALVPSGELPLSGVWQAARMTIGVNGMMIEAPPDTAQSSQFTVHIDASGGLVINNSRPIPQIAPGVYQLGGTDVSIITGAAGGVTTVTVLAPDRLTIEVAIGDGAAAQVVTLEVIYVGPE